MQVLIRQRVYDEIRQSIRDNINDKDPRIDSKAGTFVSDVFVAPASDELAATYIDMKYMELQQSILTAVGYDLDRLAQNYFTYRKSGMKATGRVKFFIKNSNRPNLTESMLPSEISIPTGYEVATAGSMTDAQIIYKTLEPVYMTRRQMFNSALVDSATGYKYVEVEVECEETGERGNVGANTIIQFYSGNLDGIVAVSNSLATTGGQDAESDTSLRFRIMLNVLGASICTKAGYQKWTFQKDDVNGVEVIGAGDDLMFRDGGFINAAQQYSYGRGGMVDIWVRGQRPQQRTIQYEITTSYKTGVGQTGGYEGIPCHDLELPDQPILRISSIVSKNTGYAYENADNYEVEYGYTGSKIERTYYKDILWDFSVTENFDDTEYYPLDVIDKTEIEVLRKQVNEELQRLSEELTNMNFSLNWKLAQYEDLSSYDVTPMFRKVYFNSNGNVGNVYKLIAVDKRLNGRTFVKRNNRIYLRVYQDPDFALVPTQYSDEEKSKSQLGKDIGGSILAKDLIHFTDKGKELIQDGDSLIITYTYNALISSLQAEMNAMRILTADILVRQAREVPLQISMDVNCELTADSVIVRNNIETLISTYVNSFIPMGGSLEDSQLVTMARSLEGVEHVDIDNVQLCKRGGSDVSAIKLQKNEYFLISDLSIRVTSGKVVK